jgi:hypothetical protein
MRASCAAAAAPLLLLPALAIPCLLLILQLLLLLLLQRPICSLPRLCRRLSRRSSLSPQAQHRRGAPGIEKPAHHPSHRFVLCMIGIKVAPAGQLLELLRGKVCHVIVSVVLEPAAGTAGRACRHQQSSAEGVAVLTG